jgi:hypothetical protein
VEDERHWIEDYYDAMLHYAWAPGDLDHLSNPERERRGRKSPHQTVKRLRKLEVAFNHILAFFFSSAPTSIVVELFKRHVDVVNCGEVTFRSRQIENELVTQPDLVFDGEDAFLTIEGKTSSKSRIEQLQKYAYLHAVAEKSKGGRAHGLLFLAPYSRQHLFKEKFEDWDAAKRQAGEGLEKDNNKKWTVAKIAKSNACDFLLQPSKLYIGFCSFADFGQLVRAFRDRTNPDSVEHRLYRGLLIELDQRMAQAKMPPMPNG